jgi:glycosyltransferase involved in cell wall biosynthesis
MKIAIDVRSAAGERAGKGWYTFNLVQKLLELEQKSGSKNEYLLYTKAGIPGLHDFPNARLKMISGRGVFWHMKVARDVQNEGCDLFFGPSSYITPSFIKAPTRVVFSVHDLVAFLFPGNHNKKATIIERLFLKRALKRADQVFTVSEHTKKDLLNLFDYEENKIMVLPCAAASDFKPLPPEDLQEFAQKEKIPKKFFLAVGTILPRKNYLRLLRAFAKVAAMDSQLHLIIIGGPGWKYKEVRDEVRRLYLQKKVHFLGYVSGKSLVRFYNLALALVFPSLYEGFGIPPLEAMQCGCPVIASNISSIPEVVGEAALMVDPENAQDIGGAMIKILKDSALQQSLKTKGQEQAQKFSWKRGAEKLQKLLSK